MYTPPIWQLSALLVFMATMGLADAALAAWWIGSAWGTGAACGTIVGLAVSVAWAVRHYRPAASIGLLVIAVTAALLLARSSFGPAGFSVLVALVTWGIWHLTYDVWFTGRANAEFVTPVIRFGEDGRAGRALIVYHQGRGPGHFQARMQRAFAEGLRAQGWQVDITTASHQAPTDLSTCDMLVLGAQAYNWCPARPVMDYIDRVGDLAGKPVVAIVSGGGMTERAMRILRTRIVKAGGVILDAIEIWTSRSNEERHGLSDPEAIMNRAGARLTLAPRRKTA